MKLIGLELKTVEFMSFCTLHEHEFEQHFSSSSFLYLISFINDSAPLLIRHFYNVVECSPAGYSLLPHWSSNILVLLDRVCLRTRRTRKWKEERITNKWKRKEKKAYQRTRRTKRAYYKRTRRFSKKATENGLTLPNPVEPRNIDNFLNPPTDEEILNAANINPEHFQTKPCSVCGERMIQGNTKTMKLQDIENWNFTKFQFIIRRLKIYRLYKVIMFSMHAKLFQRFEKT